MVLLSFVTEMGVEPLSAAADMKMFSSPSWLAMRIRPQLRFDWVISYTREAISTGVLFVEVPDGF